MAKTVASRKQKGMRFQKKIIEKILFQFPDLTKNDIRSIPSSVPGPDLWLSERAKRRIPIDWEAKCQEHLDIWSAIKQVEIRCKNDIPIVAFSRNRSKSYVCLGLENFLTILELATRRNNDM